MMKKLLPLSTSALVLAFFLATAPVASAFAKASQAKPYLEPSAVDLTLLLPAPPAPDSEQGKADLNEVLATQKSRTPSEVEAAKADVTEDVWRFSDVFKNPKFKPESLPVFAKFFDRVVASEGSITDAPKNKWHRTRPFLVSELVKPAVLPLPKSGSYPSGHSTVGTMMGILLSEMVPEKHDELMARALDFAHHRVVAGVHFPSDIVAGRISGTAIVAVLMTHPEFNAEFTAAKKELRATLGLKD